jgi:hypothetical protein
MSTSCVTNAYHKSRNDLKALCMQSLQYKCHLHVTSWIGQRIVLDVHSTLPRYDYLSSRQISVAICSSQSLSLNGDICPLLPCLTFPCRSWNSNYAIVRRSRIFMTALSLFLLHMSILFSTFSLCRIICRQQFKEGRIVPFHSIAVSFSKPRINDKVYLQVRSVSNTRSRS